MIFEGTRPDSWHPLSVSWERIDLPQLAEMVRRGAGAAAAAAPAAMSTTVLRGAFPALAVPLACLGGMAERGKRRVRACGHVRTRRCRAKAEEEDEVEGTNEIWSPHFNTYKGIR